jgi:RyR domain
MIELPDIEKVSSEVHKAWMESKKANGISSRKAEDGEELMVPYEQLSEKAKDLDRNTVRTVFAAIKKLKSKRK